MSSNGFIFLPGLDGSADLLVAEFSKLSPDGYQLAPFALPDDPTLDYEGLCEHVASYLNDTCVAGPTHFIAESFSGPLAILLAHRHPHLVSRLTLVATFANSPAPWFARHLPWRWLIRKRLPNFIARYFFGADEELAAGLRFAMTASSHETLVHRIQCLLDVDVTKELAVLKCPIDYIRPTRDRLVPRHAVSTITAANPNVKVHEIIGPHLIVQTQPQKVWDCIRDAEDIH
jgi:pimeloyl-ACP methyl ester carboxylesterase